VKPARRSNVVRSEDMRARLAQAAYEVIAERGHSGFRTAAVAAHAGVSQGALLHHFPNKDALTLAAIEHAFTLATQASEAQLMQAVPNVEALLKLMIQDFQAFFGGDRFWVALDITMDASKNQAVAPAIRTIVADYRQPIYARWAARLEDMGWSEARAGNAVRMAAALVSGTAIRTLWTNQDLNNQAEMLWLPFILSESEPK
jgi:AcrR family transcriptional regulator